MLKFVAPTIWAFDLEWIPDPPTGRRVYDLPPNVPDSEVVQHMWTQGGATERDPHPYLKTQLCRIVSVAAVIRRFEQGKVTISLTTFPRIGDEPCEEVDLLSNFFEGIRKEAEKSTGAPQLIGFNITGSDLPILCQRGVALGMQAVDFCRRAEKPWDGRDYFAKYNDWCVDLAEYLCGWRRAGTLHEVATSCGIPGKMDTDGADVAMLWQQGNIRKIVEYNECDAITTYLLWARVAHFAGKLSTEDWTKETDQLEEILQLRASNGEQHLRAYLKRWRHLRSTPIVVA